MLIKNFTSNYYATNIHQALLLIQLLRFSFPWLKVRCVKWFLTWNKVYLLTIISIIVTLRTMSKVNRDSRVDTGDSRKGRELLRGKSLRKAISGRQPSWSGEFHLTKSAASKLAGLGESPTELGIPTGPEYNFLHWPIPSGLICKSDACENAAWARSAQCLRTCCCCEKLRAQKPGLLKHQGQQTASQD